VRLLLLTVLLCAGAAAQQQPPSLTQFLSLTPAQTAAIQQLNATLDQFVQGKWQREGVVNQELYTEYAKPSPDPLALERRYLEIDLIDQEIAAQQASVQAKVTAVLTPAQIALLGQISTALVQSSLLRDAGCAFLGDAIGFSKFGNTLAGFLLGYPNIYPTGATLTFAPSPNSYSGCGFPFPISIRNYLALTDAQVSAIQGLEAAYNAFDTQKQNRIADVQVEIRDETAKPTPDPLALGVRYAELVEISQELTQADQQGRTAARALLTPSQQAKLQTLRAATTLTVYEFSAEGCHFISTPAGLLTNYYSRVSCSLN